MKRSPELAPLSRDHHVALAVALKLRRAPDDAAAREAFGAFAAFMAGGGDEHFAVEEELLLPYLPGPLATRLLDEHADIRGRHRRLAQGPPPTAADTRTLGDLLAAHVRFEERELFPLLERDLSPAQLAGLGARLTPDPS